MVQRAGNAIGVAAADQIGIVAPQIGGRDGAAREAIVAQVGNVAQQDRLDPFGKSLAQGGRSLSVREHLDQPRRIAFDDARRLGHLQLQG